ncbi:hypothetical protein Tco_0744773 [Tanacetum coccineum]
MDHICEEVNSLYSKLEDMKSSIVQQVLVEFKSSLPALVTDSLKEQLLSLLLDALKDTLPRLLKDSIKSSVWKSIVEELPHVEARICFTSEGDEQIPSQEHKEIHQNKGQKWDERSLRQALLQQKSLKRLMLRGIRANIVDIVHEEQPSAQVVLNKEKTMVVHNPEEKKERTVSMEDDSDDDDLDK